LEIPEPTTSYSDLATPKRKNVSFV